MEWLDSVPCCSVAHLPMLCVSAVNAVPPCPYVCLAVTFVHSMHMTEDIVNLLSRPGSPVIVVFDPQRRYPIPRGIPSAVAQNTRRVGKFLRFSTEIAVYLRNGRR